MLIMSKKTKLNTDDHFENLNDILSSVQIEKKLEGTGKLKWPQPEFRNTHYTWSTARQVRRALR